MRIPNSFSYKGNSLRYEIPKLHSVMPYLSRLNIFRDNDCIVLIDFGGIMSYERSTVILKEKNRLLDAKQILK